LGHLLREGPWLSSHLWSTWPWTISRVSIHVGDAQARNKRSIRAFQNSADTESHACHWQIAFGHYIKAAPRNHSRNIEAAKNQGMGRALLPQRHLLAMAWIVKDRRFRRAWHCMQGPKWVSPMKKLALPPKDQQAKAPHADNADHNSPPRLAERANERLKTQVPCLVNKGLSCTALDEQPANGQRMVLLTVFENKGRALTGL
jgi:hypothetical protein